jgi:quinol-cytochrome oxidoreductase complex cytochrome b subunit
VAAVLILVAPFLDRAAAQGRASTAWTAAGLVALVYLIVFTILGYLGT